MVEIQLHSDCLCTDTIVPNKFIDQYMSQANGEFVKVYLYLLRSVHSHTHNCSISAIADFLNHTEADVTRALHYWEKEGLLVLEHNDRHQVCKIQLRSMETEGTVPVQEKKPYETTKTAPDKQSYSADQLASFCKDPDISELFFVVETYLKHPLTPGDMNTILFWHEQLRFSNELIIYLLEYCISKGHSSLRYMDKVALSWHEQGIDTVEKAKEDAAIHNQTYYRIMKAFGISGRNLVDTELSYIKKWTTEYGFDLSLIEFACARTMTNIHQPSFEYTDTILTSWYKNHVHTISDVENLDQTYHKTRKVTVYAEEQPKKNAFNNFNQRSYDFDKLEELLLTNPVHP